MSVRLTKASSGLIVNPERESSGRGVWEKEHQLYKPDEEEAGTEEKEIRHGSRTNLRPKLNLHFTPTPCLALAYTRQLVHTRNSIRAIPCLNYGNVDKKKSRASGRNRFSAHSWKESSRPGRHTTNASFEKKT